MRHLTVRTPRLQLWRKAAAIAGAAVASLLIAASAGHATTVEPKSFDEMCAEADMVFIGTVEDVHAAWVAEEGGRIQTLVTFSDLQWLHGAPRQSVTLGFSGGELGDLAERVVGMPRFRAGERVAVFARDGQLVSPIVGFNQGCFQVVDGDGEPSVVDVHGRSARCQIDPSSCAASPRSTNAASTPLSLGLSEFVDAVHARTQARR